jgi:hypothetical protein
LIFPVVGLSRPAINRKVVVLPQPEGPSKTENSPVASVKSVGCSAVATSQLLLTLEKQTAVIGNTHLNIFL